jgi:hypothetical protein
VRAVSEITEKVLSYLPVRWRQMCALATPDFHAVLSPARRHLLAPFERGPTGCAEFVQLCVAVADSTIATGKALDMQAARAALSTEELLGFARAALGMSSCESGGGDPGASKHSVR